MANRKDNKVPVKVFIMQIPVPLYDKVIKIAETERRSRAKQVILMVETYLNERFNDDLTPKY